MDAETIIRDMARAGMIADGCGATVCGERVMCDDPRLDPMIRFEPGDCGCRRIARAAYDIAEKAIREEALEAAAKVAEGWGGKFREGSSGKVYTSTVVVICGSIAEDIRSLAHPDREPDPGEERA